MAARLKNPELRDRIDSVGMAIFVASQDPKEGGMEFGVLQAIESARAALNAFLAGDQQPSRIRQRLRAGSDPLEKLGIRPLLAQRFRLEQIKTQQLADTNGH